MAARTILFWLLFASFVSAETVEVPLLADGTVNVGAVFQTFHVNKLIKSTPDPDFGGQFNGTILGAEFSVTYGETTNAKPFDLTVLSNSLSEHATYLAAVLSLDIICLNRDVRPNILPWAATSVSVGGGWKVQASCSNESYQLLN